jgi:hypothetical protein
MLQKPEYNKSDNGSDYHGRKKPDIPLFPEISKFSLVFERPVNYKTTDHEEKLDAKIAMLKIIIPVTIRV